MKQVFFIRHAKSSWKFPELRDIDRPLNRRGLRDAPFMAKLLAGKDIRPDAILSSPANRAFTTASYFAEELGIGKDNIHKNGEIYEAFVREIMDIIRNLPNDWNTVLLFGHNPTFTSLANLFTTDYLVNVPTCGIVEVQAQIDDWSQFDESTGVLTNFYYPKQYFTK